MIKYRNSAIDIKPDQLEGFFVGWPQKPDTSMHKKLLLNSDYVILAIDTETDMVIGFITAITDHVLSCYIPLFEVLPNYQSKGIGTMLLQKMESQLRNYYMIDLVCDNSLVAYYRAFGFKKATAMSIRNYDKQSGKNPED